MLQIVALVVLGLSWVLWCLAFVAPKKLAANQTEVVRAPESKWGIGLVVLGFAFVWAYVRPSGFEQPVASFVASMVLGPTSVALVWSATRQLGKHWRYQAALSEDHELVQGGPYRYVRHPIYVSMFGMVLATGTAWSWWPMLVAGIVAFLAGTEIRIKAEDRLLAERFPQAFADYRSRVKAFVPFVR